MKYYLNHLEELESESIFILREVAAQFENPVLLFSGGKDSILMVYLAIKAFHPARVPFPLLHIDTGHNFPEALTYRDWLVDHYNLRLHVGSVQKAIDEGKIKEEKGFNASRNALQTYVLLDELEKGKYDAALGGGRRDEEKARAKERFFSHRDEFGQWDPKNQRPELWNLFNGRKHFGEHFRVFPISNWTELDVWRYLTAKNFHCPICTTLTNEKSSNAMVSFSLIANISPVVPKKWSKEEMIRCRTIGDMTCTGVWRSEATTIDEIIQEVADSRLTERGGRSDDRRSETSMEDRKKQGYF